MKPPLSQRKYWDLEDEEPDIKEMSSSVLLHYVQSWGQSNKERLDTLAEVANKIGYRIEVIENEDEYVFKVSDRDEDFEKMRDMIRDITRGNFESEVVQIAEILNLFKKSKKWYQFWR